MSGARDLEADLAVCRAWIKGSPYPDGMSEERYRQVFVGVSEEALPYYIREVRRSRPVVDAVKAIAPYLAMLTAPDIDPTKIRCTAPELRERIGVVLTALKEVPASDPKVTAAGRLLDGRTWDELPGR